MYKGDQLYMAVFFWYLVKRVQQHHFLQGTIAKRPCLSGRVVCFMYAYCFILFFNFEFNWIILILYTYIELASNYTLRRSYNIYIRVRRFFILFSFLFQNWNFLNKIRKSLQPFIHYIQFLIKRLKKNREKGQGEAGQLTPPPRPIYF